ncbi:glycosyltransferase, partial [Sulfurovum sp.]|uniref:glycosyltransferase n=1 Tax=Sulfurovum sp. TaxID=1969726 RepID=UPI0025D202D7
MRIVIDMQGAQTGSRFRGIGRYTLSLVEGILKNSHQHEIILLLFSYRQEVYNDILKLYKDFIDENNVKICWVAQNISESNTSNKWSQKTSEAIREYYIYNLKPDFLLITSFFEGYGEDFACTINNYYRVPTAIVFYDLIPLMNKDKYLGDPNIYAWYMNKIEQLKNAQLLLSISESARQEALEFLNTDSKKVINISTASDERFLKQEYTKLEKEELYQKYKISKKYLMYSGATDERKNHLRLIEAFSRLPKKVLDDHQLVFVGGMPEDHANAFKQHAKKCNLNSEQLVLTGRVSDEEMNCFYNLCTAFIFPSWHEGFGLPALEAMQCHKAVITSNTSSLPEVIEREDAMFDPFDTDAMTNSIYKVLTDSDFRISLEKHAATQAKKFTWDVTSKRVIKAMEESQSNFHFSEDGGIDTLISKIVDFNVDNVDNEKILEISECIWKNTYKNQLLIDISELIKHDSATGIQRVVRSCLTYFKKSKNISNYSIVPIYLDADNNYRYTSGMQVQDDDIKVNFFKGDIYFCLDLLHPNLIVANQNLYKNFIEKGVKINFMVYDILPIQYPEYANDGVPEGHLKWFKIILEFSDKLICISKSVRDEVKKYIIEHEMKVRENLQLEYFHLGADIDNSIPSKGLASNADKILKAFKETSTFLMVGTIEPRKGHAQTIAA